MNKYKSITIALILLSVLLSLAGTVLAESSEPFPDEEWNRTYSIGEVDDTHWMEQTSDGGYIIIGTLNNVSSGIRHSKDYFVVKTGKNGDEQWRRTFREEDEDRAGYLKQTYIMQTSDRGYLVAGSTENYKTASLNIWIRKMDSEGIEQWKNDFREGRPSRQYFGANSITGRYNEAERSVRETPDGGFLILGKTDTCLNCSIEKEQPMDIWLMKIDPKGNEEWNRTLGRTDEAAYSFTLTHDGGFIFAGVSGSNTTWFNKSDQTGNELWNRTYEGIGGRSVVIQQASDGGYAAAIADPTRSQIRIIKTDKKGFKQWEKTYGDSSFNKFQHTQDGGFLLWLSDWPDSRLLKVDQEGNEQWRRNLYDLVVSYVEQTGEGDYLLAATKLSDDVILGYTVRKLDSHGNKLWEKLFRYEFSEFYSVRKKTIAKTDDGYVVMGNKINSRDIQLKKFKNRDIPYAVFTYEPEYPGVNQAVTFDASVSNDPNENITNYRWDFGDGNITDTTGKKVTHSYDRIGEATVRLTVMNNSGGVNSTWKKVFVQKLMAPEETLNVTLRNFSGAEYARETSDRGFIIAGRNVLEEILWNERSLIYEGWLIKTDPYGKEEWNRTFRGGDLKSVIETTDGGFMATVDYNWSDIRLIKIDRTGKEEWNSFFKSKGIPPYTSLGIVFGENGVVAQTHDNGYVIAGSDRLADGLSDAWLGKTDPYGNESWSRILRGNKTGQNSLSSVQETSDGGYIVTGMWSDPYSVDAALIKVNSKGNEEWDWHEIMYWASKTYGLFEAGPVLQTSDGGFVMMGTSSYIDQSNMTEYTGAKWNTDILLMKTDAQGNELWRKGNRVKGEVDEASLSTTREGGYIYSVIVRELPENDYENADIYEEIYSAKFVKLDPDGNIEWQKRDDGYSIKPTSDGGYVTARGFQLVKFGGVRHEPLQPGILQETPITTQTQTLRPVSNETQTVTPLEKTAGFEIFLAITALLLVITIRRNRR
jgi:PKD repeat protein